MAAHRSVLRHCSILRHCSGALAICAVLFLVALQLLAGGGLAAAAGHSVCASAPMREGAPPAHPQPDEDCGSCLLCQQRGSALSGFAVAPPEAPLIVPGREGADAPAVAWAGPAERRAGRGGGSSRAPPAFG